MIYIELFHGRKRGEELQDWGTPGPVFASRAFFHTTYACEIKFDDGEHVLSIVGSEESSVSGCVYYDGVFYGDWSVSSQEVFDGLSNLGARLTVFDREKARLPASTEARRNTAMKERILVLLANVWRWVSPFLLSGLIADLYTVSFHAPQRAPPDLLDIKSKPQENAAKRKKGREEMPNEEGVSFVSPRQAGKSRSTQ